MILNEITKKELLVIDTINSQNQIIQKPLRDSVKKSIKNYLHHLNNEYINNLYELVLSELERPLLDIIMQYTRGNQTKAAIIMGINRGTLRKKLKKYGMN